MQARPRHNKFDESSRPQYEAIDSYTFTQHRVAILRRHVLSNSPFAVQLPLMKYNSLNISLGSSSQDPAASHHSSHVLTSQSATVRVSQLYWKILTISNVHYFFLNLQTSVPFKGTRLKYSSICRIVKVLKKVKRSWQCMWNYRSSEEREVKLAP